MHRSIKIAAKTAGLAAVALIATTATTTETARDISVAE